MLSEFQCLPPGREREQLFLERGAPAPLGVSLRLCACERGRKVLHVGAGGLSELPQAQPVPRCERARDAVVRLRDAGDADLEPSRVERNPAELAAGRLQDCEPKPSR
jgi:hypothetical protein